MGDRDRVEQLTFHHPLGQTDLLTPSRGNWKSPSENSQELQGSLGEEPPLSGRGAPPAPLSICLSIRATKAATFSHLHTDAFLRQGLPCHFSAFQDKREEFVTTFYLNRVVLDGR